MKEYKYIFSIIPDLAEKPQTYLIYRSNDRSQPIAHVVFEDGSYKLAGDKDLSVSEQLDLLFACDNFLKERFYYNWD